MNRAIPKPCGLVVLPVLLAALLAPVTANAADYSCAAELPVEVELNGDSEEQFTITITAEDDIPMPDETSLTLAGDTADSFTGFAYTEPGDYTYTVSQTAGNTDYMTYDDAVYNVVIQVTNTDEGGLTYQIFANRTDNPEEKAAAVRFLNTYAPPAEPTPAPSATPAPGTTPAPTAAPSPVPTPVTTAVPTETAVPSTVEPTPYDPGHPDIAGDETWGAAPTATPAASGGLLGWLVPQTSDSLPLTGLVVVAIVAAAAVVALLVWRRRNGQDRS